MTDSDTHAGIVKRVSHAIDEDGRMVLEAVVHFHDGNTPEFRVMAIWKQLPVRVVEIGADGERAQDTKP